MSRVLRETTILEVPHVRDPTRKISSERRSSATKLIRGQRDESDGASERRSESDRRRMLNVVKWHIHLKLRQLGSDRVCLPN